MKFGNCIELISGQHIEASDCNFEGDGLPYREKGDILLTVKGSGTGTIAVADKKYCISRQLMAIRCNKISSSFAQYILEANQKKFNSDAAGLIPGITRSDVLGLIVPDIKITEQRAIADLLSTWDAAIEKTERLIAAKEKRLSAYRNQLFNRKKAQNRNGWKSVKSCDILNEHGKLSTGREPVFSVSVHKGLVNQIEHLGRSFSAAKTDHYNRVHYGDIVYTKSPTGDFPYGIVKQSSVTEDVIVSPLYGVFTPISFEIGIILDFYFESPVNARNYLYPIIQKGAKSTINITNKTFLSSHIVLPTTQKEQQEIASFIKFSRQEKKLLKKQLEKYKLQKRGLMQKLLTGKWLLTKQ